MWGTDPKGNAKASRLPAPSRFADPSKAERSTGPGAMPADPRQLWRSMFVDEIEDPAITDDPWQTADNYTPICNNIDELAIDVNNSPSCSRQA